MVDPNELLDLIKKTKSSHELDEILGLKESLVSESIKNDEAYTDGLTGAEALYTSYKDLLTIHQDLVKRNVSHFADLGAGICRSKILFDFLNSPFQSYAYEFVPERINEAIICYQSLGLKHREGFQEGDIKNFNLNNHEAFLLYLPVGPTLEIIIEKLKKISCEKPRLLYVIESHGDLNEYLKDHLWSLKSVASYPLHSQRHLPNLNVYELTSSAEQLEQESKILNQAKKTLNQTGVLNLQNKENRELLFLFKKLISFEYLQLLIDEGDFEWLACLWGWRYGIQKDTIETIYPYRIHNLKKIKALVVPNEKTLPYIKERREDLQSPLSTIRKIKVSPVFGVERANGHFESF